MKRIFCLFVFLFPLLSVIWADTLKCERADQRIVCTYFSDRSDGSKDIVLKFHWISPKSPVDDRTKEVTIPPYYGSAYDYRFVPGRVPGHWEVDVIKDGNQTIKTFFDINDTEDDFFNE